MDVFWIVIDDSDGIIGDGGIGEEVGSGWSIVFNKCIVWGDVFLFVLNFKVLEVVRFFYFDIEVFYECDSYFNVWFGDEFIDNYDFNWFFVKWGCYEECGEVLWVYGIVEFDAIVR